MKTYRDILEKVSDVKFAKVLFGGSIGGKTIRSARDTKGMKFDKVFDTKDEAKAEAKMSNKNLSPGEKSYYRMSYKVVQTDANGIGLGK
jgi:inosine/xanthosine triphosphate pyrophosphatase family protein